MLADITAYHLQECRPNLIAEIFANLAYVKNENFPIDLTREISRARGTCHRFFRA